MILWPFVARRAAAFFSQIISKHRAEALPVVHVTSQTSKTKNDPSSHTQIYSCLWILMLAMGQLIHISE